MSDRPGKLCPPLRTFVAPVSAPKVLAPVTARRGVREALPAVARALTAERGRVAALFAVTPQGGDEKFRAALRRGGTVGAYRETLAVREVERMIVWMRGG